MLRDAFLTTDDRISAEEGCTATAVLMWRDEGAVCLQVRACTPSPPHPATRVVFFRPRFCVRCACHAGGHPPPFPARVALSQVANVGDSAALFVDPATGAASELTEDHRLSNPSERERLQRMGIQVWRRGGQAGGEAGRGRAAHAGGGIVTLTPLPTPAPPAAAGHQCAAAVRPKPLTRAGRQVSQGRGPG